MGVPATSSQIAIQKTPWGEFLKSVADGTQVPDYQYNSGYCIVSWLYTKPFPAMKLSLLKQQAEKIYGGNLKEDNIAESLAYKLSDSYRIPVLFKEKLSPEDLDNIHFDAVMLDKGVLRISNSDGYIVTVTGMGNTVNEAADKVETLLKKIVVPGAFYRNDFKSSNYHKSRNDLIDWGYLNEKKDDELKDKLLKILK